MPAVLTARRSWPAETEETLRREYAAGGLPAACAALPDRSRSAVKNRVLQLGLKRPPRRWTPAEDAVLREKYPAGATAADLARELNRAVPAVRRRCFLLGVTSGRMWTPDEVEAVRAGYRTLGAKKLARQLLGGDGESEVWQVYRLAERLGVTNPKWVPGEVYDQVRTLNAQGWGDARIARHLVAGGLIGGVNAREKVTAIRGRRLKLPRVEQTAAERRAMGRKGYEAQRAATGGENARTAAHRELAASYGLPADTPKRAVEILVALASGPKTRAGLKALTGCDPVKLWNALGTSYLGGLVRKGLVAKVGKPATYFLTPAALDLLAKGGGDVRQQA